MENPAPNKNRKTPFSISFLPDDFEEISAYLKAFSERTGIEFSRNELIRRAVLAHIRYEADTTQSYSEVFIATRRGA